LKTEPSAERKALTRRVIVEAKASTYLGKSQSKSKGKGKGKGKSKGKSGGGAASLRSLRCV
jgi:hypothetical protein